MRRMLKKKRDDIIGILIQRYVVKLIIGFIGERLYEQR